MDINDLRVVMTVLAFVSFMGIVAWAYGRARKDKFDDAANLPFTTEHGEDVVTIQGTEDKR